MVLSDFVQSIPDFYERPASEQIDWFALFLSKYRSQSVFKAPDISKCFDELTLAPYKDIGRYLRASSSRRKGSSSVQKYIRKGSGEFVLNSPYSTILSSSLSLNPRKKKVEKSLQKLKPYIVFPNENDFFNELVDCFEVGAYRASIIMAWNLSIHHLFHYVFIHKLHEFNTQLAKNTDKRIKIKTIARVEDFGEIPEQKFIEFCRQARIIDNNVRKILEVNLGLRNSFAHPSSLKAVESRVLAMIEELVTNVIVVYKI